MLIGEAQRIAANIAKLPELVNARPIAHVLVITKNTNQSVCYNAVTALTERFCQNAVGHPPGPSTTR